MHYENAVKKAIQSGIFNDSFSEGFTENEQTVPVFTKRFMEVFFNSSHTLPEDRQREAVSESLRAIEEQLGIIVFYQEPEEYDGLVEELRNAIDSIVISGSFIHQSETFAN